jgi:hypothetical protein
VNDAEPRSRHRRVSERITDTLIHRENRPATSFELAFHSGTAFGWTRRAVKKMVERGELEVVKADHHNVNLYRLP